MFKKFFYKLFGGGHTLTLYFKGGATVSINGVTDWSVKANGNEIVGLSVVQHPGERNRLIVTATNLAEIVAITRS